MSQSFSRTVSGRQCLCLPATGMLSASGMPVQAAVLPSFHADEVSLNSKN